MTKTFSLLFVFLFLVSCGKGGSGGGSSTPAATDAQEITTQTPIDQDSPTDPVPNDAVTFEVNAKLIGFTDSQEKKFQRAVELIKEIVASEKFKAKVLGKTYNGKKQFVDNGGLSNSKIYQRILDAAEKLGTTKKNNTMDVEIQLYLDNSSVAIGYTYPSVRRIWMNKKYYNDFAPHQIAGNLFHEWLHKLGFKHAVEATASRKHSVPYAIGYMVRDMAKELND